MTNTAKIFIDGEAGTTGLGIRERLATQAGIALKSLPDADRKNPDARRAIMQDVDLVVLCLPDDAARESVQLAGANGPKILDASTAHRVDPAWTYGFPELTPAQAGEIAAARLVANPGCYPSGAIALLRPLTDHGLLPADYPVVVNSISGYSGGGKSMIERFEKENAAGHPTPFEAYGLDLEHKHIPELQTYSKLTRRPVFLPSVGNFRQGMLTTIALYQDMLSGGATPKLIQEAFLEHYRGAPLVKVVGLDEPPGRLSADAYANSDALELRVIHNEKRGQIVLMARLDNLGKGASGVAVQNIRLMLGLQG